MDGVNQRHLDVSNPVAPAVTCSSKTPHFSVVREAQIKPSQELNFKVSERRRERVEAFGLVHRMYCRAGLTAENENRMRVMKHHLLDTTDVMVAKRGTSVEFTITLVRDGEYGLPAGELFGDEIGPMRAAGVSLAEVSCVAGCSDQTHKKRSFKTLISMLGLTMQVARRHGVERVLLAVHPRHARIYCRMFGCVVCSDVREYDAVQGNPAVLCMHDFRETDRSGYSLYDQIYGTRYRAWELDGIRMSDAEKRFFGRAVNNDASIALPIAA